MPSPGDGSFLSGNVRHTDFLTDSEIQSGSWLYEHQIDPGTYHVMLNADPDFGSCYRTDTGTYDPACANGYSAVATLVIPKPSSRYSVRVRREAELHERIAELRDELDKAGVPVPIRGGLFRGA